jgi:hypothetical protein
MGFDGCREKLTSAMSAAPRVTLWIITRKIDAFFVEDIDFQSLSTLLDNDISEEGLCQ